jgi:hypothetical protein
MSRRSTRIWLALASIFTLINIGGAVVAVVWGEAMHTAVHVALTVAGAWLVRRLIRAGSQQAPALQPRQHLDRLEQSVDAMALEVERIGEAQRFMVRLQEERAGDKDRT